MIAIGRYGGKTNKLLLIAIKTKCGYKKYHAIDPFSELNWLNFQNLIIPLWRIYKWWLNIDGNSGGFY